jgi:GTP pyrophosphokinase
VTSSTIHGPSRDWLKIAKSPQARNKINQWFKKEERDENVIRGKENLEREVKKSGLTAAQIMKPEWIDIVLKKYNFGDIEDLYAAIGYGGISANKILTRLKDEYKKTLKPEELLDEMLEQGRQGKQEKSDYKPSENGIVVRGIDNCLVKLSRCCNPLPGDPIVGYITRGRGVSVHRKDCTNIVNDLDCKDRMIDVEWFTKADALAYKTDITLFGDDRPGLLLDITSTVSEIKVPLRAMNARSLKNGRAQITLTLELGDINQLDGVIKKLRRIQGILQINRT